MPPSSCPCKNITWSLSSFTAAEFGDVNALSKALKKGNGSRSSSGPSKDYTGGITPLHLAAQHGHVAATWLLLEQGHPVDGFLPPGAINETSIAIAAATPENNSSSRQQSTCTPLHRASFSGAIATMRLLLETKRADLLARDGSFGDQRTPLHKAAGGGRHLAVALLLDALRTEGLLREALVAVDQNQETPLQVALACQRIQEDERQSVARWDVVAGGCPADWNQCVSLLQEAEKETGAAGDSSGSVQKSNVSKAKLPQHRFAEVDCLDCDTNGECVTATWAAAFQKALQQSVSVGESSAKPQQSTKKTMDPIEKSPQLQPGQDPATLSTQEPENTNECPTKPNGAANQQQETTSTPPVGRSCASCGRQIFVLFPSDGGGLVCKKCKPRRRREDR